jgi:hypothetical protein
MNFNHECKYFVLEGPELDLLQASCIFVILLVPREQTVK